MISKMVNYGKISLAKLIKECTEEDQIYFKRKYCRAKADCPVDEAVKNMNDRFVNWSII